MKNTKLLKTKHTFDSGSHRSAVIAMTFYSVGHKNHHPLNSAFLFPTLPQLTRELNPQLSALKAVVLTATQWNQQCRIWWSVMEPQLFSECLHYLSW